MAIPFKDHSSILVCDTTGSGKSYFTKRLLEARDDLFETPPTSILFCYSAHQPIYDEIAQAIPRVHFHRGLPSESQINELASKGPHNLLVLDDLANNVITSKEMSKLFLVDNHHKGLTTIFITQNLFQRGAHARDISLNCHYFVLLKNLRDINQIAYLGRQIYGSRYKALTDSYSDCIKEKYGYLVCDVQPHSDDDYRLRSKIFPGEDTIIYRLKS